MPQSKISRPWCISLVASALLFGCSTPEKYTEKPLEVLYKEAESSLNAKDYERAADQFDEVERQYPYAQEAAKAQLLSAFSAYKAQKFARAISTLDVFISVHPASPSISYAYYLRALCYYTDIYPVLRDKENAELALQALDEVVRRFPDTDYAQDARLKIDFIKEHLASQEMVIAKHYLESRQYISALNRFGGIARDFPRSVLSPEVLYRIVECQVALGLGEGAQKTIAMLEHNFPKEIWTQMAKDVLAAHSSRRISR